MPNTEKKFKTESSKLEKLTQRKGDLQTRSREAEAGSSAPLDRFF